MKNAYVYLHKCINDKVKVLNGFINVFERNVLLTVTLTPMTVMTDIDRGTLSV